MLCEITGIPVEITFYSFKLGRELSAARAWSPPETKLPTSVVKLLHISRIKKENKSKLDKYNGAQTFPRASKEKACIFLVILKRKTKVKNETMQK